MFLLKIRFLIAALAIIALNTVLVLSQQPSQPNSCVIIATDSQGHHAVCKGASPNPVCRDYPNEPECKRLTLTWDKGTWPSAWVGSREPGTVYRVRWSDGEHRYLPSAARCREIGAELTAKQRKRTRAGVDDGLRNATYFNREDMPRDCAGLN